MQFTDYFMLVRDLCAEREVMLRGSRRRRREEVQIVTVKRLKRLDHEYEQPVWTLPVYVHEETQFSDMFLR